MNLLGSGGSGGLKSPMKSMAPPTSEAGYFVLSQRPKPKIFMATVHAHWTISNALHWQFDVALRESAARSP